jgi:phosphonoacetaldehyde hydrolase
MANHAYTGPLKAALLDWAGTTMDYGCYAPAVAFVDVYKRRGVEISMEEARIPMGAHKKVHIRKISQIPDVAERWQRINGQACTEDDVESMFQEFVPIQLQCLPDYADLIPGTVETVDAMRERGLKIGSTTGYLPDMMEILQEEARNRGYEPDSTVCAGDVPAGRPEPWMCLRNAEKLGVYPMKAIVKIGDTLPDIEEGLNAGMWTVGLAKTGNEMGLNEAEVAALPPEELKTKLERAFTRLQDTGAHYVVEEISDVLPILDAIDQRLAKGESPQSALKSSAKSCVPPA